VGAVVTAATRQRDEMKARRLWLPWRPRLRLIFPYPRGWHYVTVWLGRFDVWLTHRYTGSASRIALAVALLPFIVVRFLGFVVVVEITIIAFALSIYLVWAEWLLLLLLFPFALLARFAQALSWRLVARAGDRRWTADITGWRASSEAATGVLDALRAGSSPSEPPWSPTGRPVRIWM
jgi:hypothetical protein